MAPEARTAGPSVRLAPFHDRPITGPRALPRPLVWARHNDAVAGEAGTRGGTRRAPKPKRQFRPRLLLLGLGALAALVVWGLLVWVAIDSGRSARGGDSSRWAYLAVASIGAVACLFLCLFLVTTLLRKIGILDEPQPKPRSSAGPHRH